MQTNRHKAYEPAFVRLSMLIPGAVQGVGFRPFVYRLAIELGLLGWVNNSTKGVEIEAEGPPEAIAAFCVRVKSECPSRENIDWEKVGETWLDPVGYDTFTIVHSNGAGEKTVFMMPDLATCPKCLAEMFDPSNRRYLYPFINCTECGPRLSIIHALPYDRPNTTMKHFEMCPACQAEYDDPFDRRFHAQPNACPVCGPQVALWNAQGETLAHGSEAMTLVAQKIRDGHIVAIKGIGGFQLVADARNEDALKLLRVRKHREEKPFALMYPTLAMARAHCTISCGEERMLVSPQAPIVILARKSIEKVNEYRDTLPCEAVAPGNPYLGIMLPYSPLHHILMRELCFPIVATSGNRSDEPIVTDEHEALTRLQAIADYFLVHNRPIVRHVDDSIVREINGDMTMLRRARGYTLPVSLKTETQGAILATGAHQKNTVALALHNHVFMSQHIGDLNTPQTQRAFVQAMRDVTGVYEQPPQVIACDMHPDYLSTQWAQEEAERTGVSLVSVQHHHAHVLACMADNKLDPPLLGVAFDGTGYGTDGTIWGGEFFRVTDMHIDRSGHFRTFSLPGGEAAARQPWRCALGLLWEIYGEECFTLPLPSLNAITDKQRTILAQQMKRSLNTPRTSSVGRLFDAVASLIGIRQQCGYEGQAAMELEWACNASHAAAVYPYDLRHDEHGMIIIDWQRMIQTIVEEVRQHVPQGRIAANFHATLAHIIAAVAARIGENAVALSGGCFQNKHLTEKTIAALQDGGFTPYVHHRVPPNDGSIALGQAAAVIGGYH